MRACKRMSRRGMLSQFFILCSLIKLSKLNTYQRPVVNPAYLADNMAGIQPTFHNLLFIKAF